MLCLALFAFHQQRSHRHKDISNMQHSLTILFALTVLGVFAPIQAVVHGIQPLSNHYDISTDNRNGYRYNGPAHKYLPSASAPVIDAVTTTGHWQPNPVQSQQLLAQQKPYEIHYSSRPMLQQQQQQQGYNGPYSMQYYDKEAQRPQQQLANSWRQQQQPMGNSYRKESQQQLSGNNWRQEQQQQQQQHQQLSSNSYQKEQQQQQLQPTSNSWQQQQHQKPQQITDISYRKEQQQQRLQPTGNSWQQQQIPSNAWQQQQQGGRQQHQEAQQQQQHLDSQQQQQHPTLAQHNNLHTFPYAGNNKNAAVSAALDQFGAPYHLSGAANGNRLLDSDMRDNRLMTQALPAPYQQQQKQRPSYESELGGGSVHYVQMQSNSYELPASYSTHSENSEKYRPQMEMSQSSYHYGEKMPIYNQPDYLHDTSSHAHSTAHMTLQPSREFQAPYF